MGNNRFSVFQAIYVTSITNKIFWSENRNVLEFYAGRIWPWTASKYVLLEYPDIEVYPVYPESGNRGDTAHLSMGDFQFYGNQIYDKYVIFNFYVVQFLWTRIGIYAIFAIWCDFNYTIYVVWFYTNYQSWIVCRRTTLRLSLKYGYFITDLF